MIQGTTAKILVEISGPTDKQGWPVDPTITAILEPDGEMVQDTIFCQAKSLPEALTGLLKKIQTQPAWNRCPLCGAHAVWKMDGKNRCGTCGKNWK